MAQVNHKPVTVMLIGVGGYGGVYVNLLLDSVQQADVVPAFEFVAGVDPAPGRCLRYTELQTRQIPMYADIEAALAQHQPELIIISTPIHTHLPLCKRALLSGASVLLEKPLCGTVQEADEMLEAESNAPGFVAVGFQCRFAANTQQFLVDINAGKFGELQSMKTLALRPRGHDYYQRSSWAGAITALTGEAVYDSPVMNASAHDLYLQLLIAQQFTAAAPILQRCYLSRVNAIQNFDSAAISYTCAGIEGLFLASHSVQGEETTVSECQFSEALVHLSHSQGISVHFSNGEIEKYAGGMDTRDKLDSCLRALRGGPLPPCRILDTRRHIALIGQIQEEPVLQLSADACSNDGQLTWVPGLAEKFSRSYAERDLSWAARARMSTLQRS